MSMQSEGKDAKEGKDQQATRDGTGDSGSGSMGRPATDQGNQQSGQQSSQQGAMPPSQTDDDQYDQGTVQRER
jgi:hypothetical protein